MNRISKIAYDCSLHRSNHGAQALKISSKLWQAYVIKAMCLSYVLSAAALSRDALPQSGHTRPTRLLFLAKAEK